MQPGLTPRPRGPRVHSSLGSETGRRGGGGHIPDLCGRLHSVTFGPFRTSAPRTQPSAGQDATPGRPNSTLCPRIHGPRTRPPRGCWGRRCAALSQRRLPLGGVGWGPGSRQPAGPVARLVSPGPPRPAALTGRCHRNCQGTRGRAGRAWCQQRGPQGWRLQGVPRGPCDTDQDVPAEPGGGSRDAR